jgi:hypothetical protein
MQTLHCGGVVLQGVCVSKVSTSWTAGNKEKVVRISLMTLHRLASSASERLLAAMVDAGLQRIVRIRSAQAWSDEDIPELLETLDELVGSSVTNMSSFEKYRAAVLSGELEWAPLHSNLAFWQVRARLDCSYLKNSRRFSLGVVA